MAKTLYSGLELPFIPPPRKEAEPQPLYLELEIPQEPMPSFPSGEAERPKYEIDYSIHHVIEIDIS